MYNTNMETHPILEIEDFLNIKRARVIKRPVTVLIGPQASGKSLISKLFHFFQEFLSSSFFSSFVEEKTKTDLVKDAKERFRTLFFPGSWEKQSFAIRYQHRAVTLTVSNLPNANGRNILRFQYDDGLYNLQRSIGRGVAYISKNFPEEDRRRPYRILTEKNRYVAQRLAEAGLRYAFENAIFIPAGRSFFTSLNRNVFRFIANEISIDLLLSEFGSMFEIARDFNEERFLYTHHESRSKKVSDFIDKAMEEVLSGKFVTDKEGDWIDNGRYKVPIGSSSSGQQEALPLMMVLKLAASGYSTNRLSRSASLYVEEPEAHLFPAAQDKLARVFGRLYEDRSSIFMTTHSPYLLSSMNVMLLNAPSSDKKPKIVSELPSIRFDDVSAYGVSNGKVSDIRDEELEIIGSSQLDEISSVIEQRFTALMSG